MAEGKPRKAKFTKAALRKKKRQSRQMLGDGLAGRAMDALKKRRQRMEAQLNQ